MTQPATKRLVTEATGKGLFADIGLGRMLPTPLGGGASDSTQLNAMLATIGDAPCLVRGVPGATYTVREPIRLPSNTVLDMRGCTVVKDATTTVALSTARADQRLVVNARCYDGRCVQDGAMTLSSATLTSATAAFTSADVGKKVRVYEAGHADTTIHEPLDTTIASVTNATTAVLADPAQDTVTGRPVYIGDRDSNITIIGGTWIKTAQDALSYAAEAWMYCHAFLFRHADNVAILDPESVQVRGGSAKYMFNFGEGMHFRTHGVVGDCDSDGVHITGPARHITIRDVQGRWGDDITAFCLGENGYGNGTGDTQGDIFNVRVDNISGTWDGICFKIAGSSYGYKAHRFRVSNIGQNRNIGVQKTAQLADDTGTPVTDDLVFSNLAGGFAAWNTGTHGSITIDGIVVTADSPAGGVEIHDGCTVQRLTVRRLSRPSAASAIPGVYVYNGSQVANLIVSDTVWPSSNVVSIQGANSQVGTLTLSNVQHGATSTGSLVYAKANSLGVATISAIGCITGATYAYVFEVGTVALTVAGGIYKALVSADGASTIVTVFGSCASLNNASYANGKTNSAVIRAWAPGWYTDASTITADTVGQVVNNSNSGLTGGRGLMQVISGNRWRHLPTGRIYSALGTPSVAAQAGAGTGATASRSGDDGIGDISVTLGTSPAAGDQVKLTVVSTLASTPLVSVEPTNAAAVAAGLYVSAATTTSFTVAAANAPTGPLTFRYRLGL